MHTFTDENDRAQGSKLGYRQNLRPAPSFYPTSELQEYLLCFKCLKTIARAIFHDVRKSYEIQISISMRFCQVMSMLIHVFPVSERVLTAKLSMVIESITPDAKVLASLA